MAALKTVLGVKTDPIEYRYSYEWLFSLLGELGIRHVQLGTFFEMYQLPDSYFSRLRRLAAEWDISISSVFTAHRELGGFFRDDGDGWELVARKNFERLIEIASLVGATAVGSNPGAVLRDRMGVKPKGLATYLRHMKELMHLACEKGVQWLTIEPMSCLAEPPTLPEEIVAVAEELWRYHGQNCASTARMGYCCDIAHGYADGGGMVRHNNLALLEASLPYTCELHLKNTDARFDSTFGFAEQDRARGVVDVPALVSYLRQRQARLPVQTLVGYLEIGGPKLGRDYSDRELEAQLRSSLEYLKQTFECESETEREEVPAICVASASADVAGAGENTPEQKARESAVRRVRVSPSLMCADLCNLAAHLRRLEEAGADLWHFDVMDYHFAPNMPLGLATLEQTRPVTGLPFDVHLMVENNDEIIPQLARLGVENISVHAETARHLDRTLQLIRGYGIRAGVALNPATPLEALDYVLESLDYVVLMTVNPGFAGQKLVPSALRKIAGCREYLQQRGAEIPIEVDGNVSFANIPGMVAAGADILVAGSSSVFHKESGLRENFTKIRAGIAEGLAARKPARPLEGVC